MILMCIGTRIGMCRVYRKFLLYTNSVFGRDGMLLVVTLQFLLMINKRKKAVLDILDTATNFWTIITCIGRDSFDGPRRQCVISEGGARRWHAIHSTETFDTEEKRARTCRYQHRKTMFLFKIVRMVQRVRTIALKRAVLLC
jgi:hypothetical protein